MCLLLPTENTVARFARPVGTTPVLARKDGGLPADRSALSAGRVPEPPHAAGSGASPAPFFPSKRPRSRVKGVADHSIPISP